MVAPHPGSADSYESFFRNLKYPEKSCTLLAQAIRHKLQAEGHDPELEESFYRFVGEASRILCKSTTLDADIVVLQGLSQIVSNVKIGLPSWVDPALRGVDWVHVYNLKDRSFEPFWHRASQLGLEPQPAELVRAAKSLDEDLKLYVRTDEVCRQIWRDRIAAQPAEDHWWRVAELARPPSDPDTQRYFCEILADDIGLSGQDRETALSHPERLPATVRGKPAAAARLEIRRWRDSDAAWDPLEPLSIPDLVALVEYCARQVVTWTKYPADAANLKDAVRDFEPVLRELSLRGPECLKLLARKFLVDPPGDEAQSDWRAAVLDLPNLVMAWWFRLPSPRPSPVIPGGWMEISARLEFFESIAALVAEEDELVPDIERWIEILTGKRNPDLTNPAAKIADAALVGRVRAGHFDFIERQLTKLTGSEQRLAGTRATLKEAVAVAARGFRRVECEKFAIRLLSRPDVDQFSIELAVAVAMETEVESEDVLSTPEKAQLNTFGTGLHRRAIGRDEVVALARRLKATPEILGALLACFHSLPNTRDLRVTLPPSHGTRIRRLKEDAKTLEFLGGVPVGLADLLYATGDPRLSPREWNQLALWHLGAGHGIEEFVKDACRGVLDDQDRIPLGEVSPEHVQRWMSDVLAETENEAAPPLVVMILQLLARILSISRKPEVLPWYRLHEDWKRFAKNESCPATWGLEDFPLHFFPTERLPLMDDIYARLRPLAETTQEAWKLFASLATGLLRHPAYPNLVTEDVKKRLIEDAKKVLMDLRMKAPAASPDSELPPALHVALSVLCIFKDVSAAIRQLLMVYREVPFPCVPPSLSTQESVPGKKWTTIPYTISLLIQISPPNERDDIRYRVADFLQDRLKPRREASRDKIPEDCDLIECDPIVREAYVEALGDLRTDRGGRLHRLLGNVARYDPSDAVKAAARRCAARARKSAKEAPRGSVGRFILDAWWWIRRGTTLRFGPDFVDAGLAKVTRALEATRLRGSDSLN